MEKRVFDPHRALMNPLPFWHQHKWLGMAGIVLTGLMLFFGVRWWQGPFVTLQPVTQQDFIQTVVASGHVESPHRVGIGSPITGTVRVVPVHEGQAVTAGTLLTALDDTELQSAVRQADATVAQALAKLRQLRALQAPVAEQAQRQAQANLDNVRATLRRNENLYHQQFIGAATLDESRKAVELADAQWRVSQMQVQTTQPGGSDYAVAEVAIAQARASADVAHARAQNARITAPVDGTLIARNVEPGDVVQPGKVLMTLSPHGQPQVVLTIDEKNLRLIALGQKALVSADAYPQQKFEAELVYINPGVNAQTGAVEVKLQIAEPPATLRQDMTVSVDIEVARRPKALLLPLTAVHDADGPAPWVLQVENGRTVKTPVRLGLRSGGLGEVLEGLSQNAWVVAETAGTTSVTPGMRVRTRATE